MANEAGKGGAATSEAAGAGKDGANTETLAGGAAAADKGGKTGGDGKDGGDQGTGDKGTTKPAAGDQGGDEGKGKEGGKAPSGKSDDDKGGKDGEAGAKPKAPEKYELTLPEGGRLTASDLKQIEAVARAEGWTNEETQARLVAHSEALEAQSAAFLAETEADATYGGEKLEETQKLARTVLERVRPAGTPRGDALRGLLNRSGYGNNIEVISFLADLGKMMREDGHESGPSGGSSKKSAEEVLYGKT